MIEKIKAIARIKEELESLKLQMKDLNSNVESIKLSIKELKGEILQVRENEFLHCNGIADALKTISEYKGLGKELKEEIYDFKVLKSELHKKAMMTFQDELKEALSRGISQINSDMERYRKMNIQIESITDASFKLTEEIERFNGIAQKIRSSDFELVRHKKNLDSMDREKLILLKKIDSLERMVSKMRRGSSH